ncbi:MAG: thioredoxin family protein [Planctomycetes bacterium]|nr:thioredoxin family protein [Planctomycetota bacterium]
MIKKTLKVALMSVIGLATCALILAEDSKPASAPAVEWLTSYAKAVEAAKKDKKLILADFTGSDWCGWCKKLKAEVFDTDEFKTWAAKNVILLELDFPKKKQQDDATKKQNQELNDKYKIEGFPTILFLKADGTKVGQTGYVKGGAKVWIENAQKIIEAAKG